RGKYYVGESCHVNAFPPRLGLSLPGQEAAIEVFVAVHAADYLVNRYRSNSDVCLAFDWQPLSHFLERQQFVGPTHQERTDLVQKDMAAGAGEILLRLERGGFGTKGGVNHGRDT